MNKSFPDNLKTAASGPILACILLSGCSISIGADDAEPAATEAVPAVAKAVSDEQAVEKTEVAGKTLTDVPAKVEDLLVVEETPTSLAITNAPVGLNVRSAASASSEIVAQVMKDRVLTATGETSNGWVQVSIDEVTGWVNESYVIETDAVDPGPDEVASDESTESAEDTDVTATAQADSEEIEVVEAIPANGRVLNVVVSGVDEGINIRSGPGAEFAIVESALLGDTAQTTGRHDGDWAEITYNGTTGWAPIKYFFVLGE